MDIGMIGLGTMGTALADRLLKAGHTVFGFDIQPEARDGLRQLGGYPVESINELKEHVTLFWIMVPAGKVVDDIINHFLQQPPSDTIIIDGGNSKFTDSIRRAERLRARGIGFLDCGVSGGVHGREIGFSIMVGGELELYQKVTAIFEAVAAHDSYALVGPSGAGHYVKMVHNGIEYALLQSYAEGFQLLKEGRYKNLDLEKISGVWKHAAIIRSYILDLAHTIFKKDQSFEKISGKVGQTGMGGWTVEEARKDNIPVPLIEDAVTARDQSQQTGGTYATKLVSLLRNQFGGHTVHERD